MEYCTAERKKKLQPFATAWMKLRSIRLSEISQEVKDKYHMKTDHFKKQRQTRRVSQIIVRQRNNPQMKKKEES